MCVWVHACGCVCGCMHACVSVTMSCSTLHFLKNSCLSSCFAVGRFSGSLRRHSAIKRRNVLLQQTRVRTITIMLVVDIKLFKAPCSGRFVQTCKTQLSVSRPWFRTKLLLIFQLSSGYIT